MKNRKILILAACTALFTASSTHAILTDSLDGTLTDDLNTLDTSDDLLWLPDIAMFAPMTYIEQLHAIANLVFAGRDDWRMAHKGEVETLVANGLNTIGPYLTITSVGDSTPWQARTTTVYGTGHDALKLYFDGSNYLGGFGGVGDFNQTVGAFAVAYAVPRPATVPDTANTLGLVGLAAFGLLVMRRRIHG